MSEMVSPRAETITEPEAILAIGKRALAAQAEGIWSLAHQTDHTFVEAAQMLLATSGRIVCCGLGKSGIIAHKMAATLTSTGAPASFLHAAEAVHGDLGIMMAGDTLVIFSNSGDTREFGVILRRAEALGVPVIAITSRPDSAVAAGAGICLVLPAKAEACPFGTTPTTSTTMMLALGDALTIAVMQARGVGPQLLQALHPGGRLGLDLTVVDSFMHREDELPLVTAEASMSQVVQLISAKGFGVAGVRDPHGRLLGVITDGDVRRHVDDVPRASAGEIMTERPLTLFAGSIARDALAMLTEAKITSLFVLDNAIDKRVVGLVHIHDLLRLGVG